MNRQYIAEQPPQLALYVILGGKTWPEAIATNWREVGSWQPGWVYDTEVIEEPNE